MQQQQHELQEQHLAADHQQYLMTPLLQSQLQPPRQQVQGQAQAQVQGLGSTAAATQLLQPQHVAAAAPLAWQDHRPRPQAPQLLQPQQPQQQRRPWQVNHTVTLQRSSQEPAPGAAAAPDDVADFARIIQQHGPGFFTRVVAAMAPELPLGSQQSLVQQWLYEVGQGRMREKDLFVQVRHLLREQGGQLQPGARQQQPHGLSQLPLQRQQQHPGCDVPQQQEQRRNLQMLAAQGSSEQQLPATTGAIAAATQPQDGHLQRMLRPGVMPTAPSRLSMGASEPIPVMFVAGSPGVSAAAAAPSAQQQQGGLQVPAAVSQLQQMDAASGLAAGGAGAGAGVQLSAAKRVKQERSSQVMHAGPAGHMDFVDLTADDDDDY